MPETFHTPTEWIERRLHILQIGAGRTGGEVSYALARVHKLLVALGHPGGLHVTLVDGDHVSPANVGTQRFAECDIGFSKAVVLVQRINMFFMLDWKAMPVFWSPESAKLPELGQFDLLITCVDRAQTRVELARAGKHHVPPLLWMDFGNGQYTGQCVLGHLGQREAATSLPLPNIVDLYPELTTLDDSDTPSCSAAAAVRQQDLFVNPLLAEAGVSLLWKLLRHGGSNSHGVLVDVREPSIDPMWIDPTAWAFYSTARPTPPTPHHVQPSTRPRSRRCRPPRPA
jgi:PRTRC genetic system ThiF family protein